MGFEQRYQQEEEERLIPKIVAYGTFRRNRLHSAARTNFGGDPPSYPISGGKLANFKYILERLVREFCNFGYDF